MAAMVILPAVSQTTINEKPFTIPEVTQWNGGVGTTMLSGRVIVKSKALATVAKQLSEDYEQLFGQKLTVSNGKAKTGDIVLISKKLDNTSQEGYQLSIGDFVEIAAPATTGAYWGTRTLLQLLETSCNLPRGIINDQPQYRLRGLMLDVGRKFMPMHYLRALVKVMAYYKMNALQLHLNDNTFPKYFDNDWSKTPAAFRLECDTYPGLTATDGSYSKAEFIELQQLAEQLHVEIIPEIDVPAHSLAFTHYRPELGSKEYGMDHLDLSNPDIYPFIDNLFKEYLPNVFRGPRVNIGTDEYSNAKQEVVEQFRAFTDHYLALVESYGKQPMLWGALTHAQGQTPVRHEGVLMNCWYNGYAKPDSMMQLGYQVVSIPDRYVYIVPAAGYYYDYLDCQYLYEHWTPAVIGDQQFEERHPQIEGGMFAVWNDHYGNGISTKDIHHRLYPALQTLAVKCWTGQLTTLPYQQFDTSRQQFSEAPGINELGRLPDQPITLDALTPGQPFNLPDVGYDYAVSFDIDCAAEEKGTILTSSSYAVFYLSDPVNGRLGFARDGYLNTFRYTLPTTGRHNIRIEGTNSETRLFVDQRHVETLKRREVYAFNPNTKLYIPQQFNGSTIQQPNDIPVPSVYDPTAKMQYVPTLFFPLQQTGEFKSTVTNVKVMKL